MKKLITMFLVVCILLCNISFSVSALSESSAETNSKLDYSKEISTQLENNTAEVVDNSGFSTAQPKVVFNNGGEPVRFEVGDELTYELQIDVHDSFDYIVASFVSSQGITLDSYEGIAMKYSESIAPLNLSFGLNDNAQEVGITLNYNDVMFEKIFVIFDIIEDNEIVQTEKVTISALFTSYGAFVSNYGNIFAYDKYISYLYENNYITDADVKIAHKEMTEIQAIDDEMIGEHLELATLEPNDIVKYYDAETRSVLSISARDYDVVSLNRLDAINENQEISLMATTTAGTIHSPSIRIDRTITALSNGDQLRVFGYVYWTDIDGVRHPARNIEVQIMDEDTTFDDTLKTVYTDNNGYYIATVDNQNDVFESGCDIYIRVNLSNSDFEIVSGFVSSIFSEGYYMTTEVTDNVTESKPKITYGNEGEDHYRSLSIHQAMVVGYYYYDKMNDGSTNTVSIKYPHDGGSDSETITDYIRIS